MKLSVGNFLVPIPRALVLDRTRRASQQWARRRAKLSSLQRKLHTIAVSHLPDSNKPLTASRIAEIAGERLEVVHEALVSLHARLGFIALDSTGSVEWAYPITVAETPHHLVFESGEVMTSS